MRAEATVLGRMLAAPMREGEPVTDVRLLEPSLLSALGRPGLVAVPVRLTDGAAAAAVLHPGDVVDVLSVGSEAGPDPSDPSASDPAAPAARVVADSVTVLSVPAAARLDGNDGGGLVVVAATATQAATLARAAVTTRLSVALRR
jgi:Flp pilus assembly protein CpaB